MVPETKILTPEEVIKRISKEVIKKIFKGDLNLDGVTITSCLDLRDATIEGELELRGATINGDLDLRDATSIF